MFDPASRATGCRFGHDVSVGACDDRVRRVREPGVSEFSIYFPMLTEQVPVFEEIASTTFGGRRD